MSSCSAAWTPRAGPAWAAPARTASRAHRPAPSYGRRRPHPPAACWARTSERARRVQAGVGAAAVPDRRAVRRVGRARRVRHDHLAAVGPRRVRPLPRAGCGPPSRPRSPSTMSQTFDLRRRCALYLTYYRYGDTRKRGMAMVVFKTAYRDAGFEPCDDELPDYLPMVLDFAALTPRGQRLLHGHRGDLELLRRALVTAGSPYADVIAAVCAQLPKLGRRELGQVLKAWESGPPREAGRPGTVRPAGVPRRLPGRANMYPRTPAAQRDEHDHRADVLVGRAALPGARRVRRRARVALAIRPVRLDQPLHPAAGTAHAQVGSPAVPLRHVRRHRRARHRRIDPRAVDQGHRHPRARLPLVLRRRRHARRGAGDRRRGRARVPPAVRAPRARHHRPDRLRHPDPAAGRSS